MRRREFIGVLGGTVAWPLGVSAQQDKQVRRIGVLMGIANDSQGQARAKAFEEALQELGWARDRNVQIHYRWAGGAVDLNPLAEELIGIAPDALLATSTTTATTLHGQTRTIPIVFVQVSDPLGSNLGASLARPGGNVTGFTNIEFSIAGKWIEILKEIHPRVARVSVMFNPQTAPFAQGYLRLVEEAGRAHNVDVSSANVRDPADLDAAMAAIAQSSHAGLVVMPDIFMTTHRDRIAVLASRYRVPAIYPFRIFMTAGGLISYGVEQLDSFRRAASYVDRILKGANPGELPIQQPTKFELVLNLKAAKALGLTVPQTLLQRADEVIE